MNDDTSIIKKVTSETFASITGPLKAEAKKMEMKESDVVNLVHKAIKAAQ